MSKLSKYKEKRDFSKTTEPTSGKKKEKKNMFVIQKHNARRLHYDFRIEDQGVLKSWAVPKEPSLSTKDKRLAIQVEDHPLSYGNFEGVIPKGNYGAGNVEIWDNGFFVNTTIKDGKLEPLSKWIKNGHFLIWIKGDRLRGGYSFNRLKDGKNWLMIKMNDEEALENKKDEEGISKTIKVQDKEIEITNSNKEIFANITKFDFVNYYKEIAPLMLKHVINRPISMFRFPHGIRQEGFFQKHVPDYFPSWMDRAEISRKGKKIKYIMTNNEASIVYLATQVCIPHILPSKVDKIKFPDKMIFDLDPSVLDYKILQEVAMDVKSFLDKLAVPSFIMTSGNKGYHIVVPLNRDTEQEDVKDFADKIAKVLVNHYSDTMTHEMRIEKRENKVFIDTYRNSITHTAVSPYSVRASLGGGIAAPVEWNEVKKVLPKEFTLRKISEYRKRIAKKNDIWKNIFKETTSIKNLKKQLKQ